MAVAEESASASPSPQQLGVPSRVKISAAVPFHFDIAVFQAILDQPFPHRQLAIPQTYGSATVAMGHFQNSLAAYADPNGYAAGPNSLHCAAVLYAGRSFVMVLDDAMFAKYELGIFADEEMRPTDSTYRAYWKGLQHNPMRDFLQPLIEAGISFFVCNNGLSGFAYEIALKASQGTPVSRETVVAIHDDLAAHFISGTMLVPSGVAAANALQEARFTYLP
jgi:intracellular sulfur oxidation DsrE/DsrF family protein